MDFKGISTPPLCPSKGISTDLYVSLPLNTERLLEALLDTRLPYELESAKHIYNPLYDDSL